MPPSQARMLDEALTKAGVEHEVIWMPNVSHGWDNEKELMKVSDSKLVAWLDGHR